MDISTLNIIIVAYNRYFTFVSIFLLQNLNH